MQQHHHVLVAALRLPQQPQLRPICQRVGDPAGLELQQLGMVPRPQGGPHLRRVPVEF